MLKFNESRIFECNLTFRCVSPCLVCLLKVKKKKKSFNKQLFPLQRLCRHQDAPAGGDLPLQDHLLGVSYPHEEGLQEPHGHRRPQHPGRTEKVTCRLCCPVHGTRYTPCTHSTHTAHTTRILHTYCTHCTQTLHTAHTAYILQTLHTPQTYCTHCTHYTHYTHYTRYTHRTSAAK